MMSLLPENVSFSHLTGGGGPARVDIALGARTGTKSGREQNVATYADTHPDLCLALDWVVSCTPPGKLLFPYSISTYRRLISNLDAQLNINAGWTPHSPRAGFATEATSNRISFVEIKEVMRHASDQSLRTYIDVVGAKAVSVSLLSAGLSPALAYARVHWLKYVQRDILQQTYTP
jgi:hypothetical protein